MFCKKCGSQISRGENYCPVCGEKIEQVTEERNNNDDFFNSYGSHRKEDPKKDEFKMEGPISPSARVFAILGFVFSIIGLFLLAIPFVPLGFFLLAIIFCILGRNAYFVKGFAIAGAAISIVGILISLLVSFTYIKLFSRNSKKSSIKKAEEVFHTAQVVLLESVESGTFDGVTVSGSVYTTTAHDLIQIGELSTTPFRFADSDGGMTVSYDRLEKTYEVTCSGTINGYTITYVDGAFVAS